MGQVTTKRVLILHNEPGDDALADERDVLDQIEAVRDALRVQRFEVTTAPCTLDLAATRKAIENAAPAIVFNLVESLARTDRLAPAATLLLESMDVPFTGSGTVALITTGSKLLTKNRLRSAGLPTADWLTGAETREAPATFEPAGQRVIVKPVWEHASFGMNDDSVVLARDAGHVREVLRQREQASGRPWFAERFIDGREFNLSLLESPGKPGEPEVLPPAEIDFVDYPHDKPRITGSAAKWDPSAPEYHRTPRRFDFPAEDQELLEQLRRLAVECWKAFDPGGYARVDFRVDATGNPWILEINTNPCLTPDAGFAAAARRAGLEYPEMIARIVACL